MGGGFHHLCPTAAFSQHGSSATWAHQRTEWDWFMSYILLLPASKGAPLEHFCCRTLLLLQGEGGGCRTLKSYRQGFAFWRGTCNLPLPAACTPQPGVSAIPPSPGLPVLPCAAAPGSVGAALVTSSSSFFQHGPGYGAQQGRGNRE